MRRKTILVADDHPGNRTAQGRLLERAGYAVLYAEEGRECVRKAEEHLPDAILLDIEMPGMSGLDVIAALKASAYTAEIPVIAFTAHAWEDIKQKARDAGVAAYLVKPTSGADIVQQVSLLVDPPSATR